MKKPLAREKCLNLSLKNASNRFPVLLCDSRECEGFIRMFGRTIRIKCKHILMCIHLFNKNMTLQVLTLANP